MFGNLPAGCAGAARAGGGGFSGGTGFGCGRCVGQAETRGFGLCSDRETAPGVSLIALPWLVSSAGGGETAFCCFASSVDVGCAQISAGKGQVWRLDEVLQKLIELDN